MSVFEFAMKMEEDGRAYYLNLAEKTEVPHLKKILNELADDELKHFKIFKAMNEKEKAEYREDEKTTIFSTTKNVFEALKTEGKDHSFGGDLMDTWKQALEVEQKSENLYREKAEEVGDDNYKSILHKIADEEKRHQMIIENVIHFLDKPKQWLEDAEWHNLVDF